MYYRTSTGEASASIAISARETKKRGCFTTLATRKSLDEDRCRDAVKVCAQDFATSFNDKRAYYIPTTENETHGNWIALVMPDAMPFRLGLMSYAATLIMLHEDIDRTSMSSVEEVDDLKDFFVGGLEAALPVLRRHNVKLQASQSDGQHEHGRKHAILRLLAPWTKALLNTDRKLGLDVLQAWSRHFRARSAMPAVEDVGSFDEYLRVRIASFGIEAWLAMMRFALGLRLNREDLEVATPAVKAMMRSVVLTTDYWSWDKRSRDSQGAARAMNAVAFTMAERECTALEAKTTVRELAIEAEDNFKRLKNKVKSGQVQVRRLPTPRLDKPMLMMHPLLDIPRWCRAFRRGQQSLELDVPTVSRLSRFRSVGELLDQRG